MGGWGDGGMGMGGVVGERVYHGRVQHARLDLHHACRGAHRDAKGLHQSRVLVQTHLLTHKLEERRERKVKGSG